MKLKLPTSSGGVLEYLYIPYTSLLLAYNRWKELISKLVSLQSSMHLRCFAFVRNVEILRFLFIVLEMEILSLEVRKEAFRENACTSGIAKSIHHCLANTGLALRLAGNVND